MHTFELLVIDFFMHEDLKNKTVSAMSWNGIQWVFGLINHFVVGVILARLLLPEKFGLIGMVTIFMGMGRIFADSGLGMALIQKKNPSHIDCCTIFYFNIAVGLLAAGLLCLAAPWIAGFFREPILEPLTRFLSLFVIFTSFTVVQSALLTGSLNFRLLGIISVASGLVSGLIAVVLALSGFGVWSLAIQQVSSGLITAVLLWSFNRWRPSWAFSFSSLKIMFKFASKLLSIGIIDVVFGSLYSVVIGRFFSPSALGLYSKAQTLTQLPAMGLTGIAGTVLFPAFSSIQDDKPRMKRALKKALTALASLIFPLMVGIAIIAKPMVHLLLGDNWLPSVPLIQILCVIGLFTPFSEVNVRPLQAIGRSDLLLHLEVFKKTLLVITLMLTYRWGVVALVAGQVVHMSGSYCLNAYYLGKHLGYSMKEQLRDVAPILGSSLLMGLVVYAGGLLAPFDHQGLLMLAQIAGGVFLFWALGKTFRFKGFSEIEGLLKERSAAVMKKMMPRMTDVN